MSYWLENGWHYWEGDPRPEANAIEVPRRPSEDYDWDGSQWVANTAKALARRRAVVREKVLAILVDRILDGKTLVEIRQEALNIFNSEQ